MHSRSSHAYSMLLPGVKVLRVNLLLLVIVAVGVTLLFREVVVLGVHLSTVRLVCWLAASSHGIVLDRIFLHTLFEVGNALHLLEWVWPSHPQMGV